MIEVGKVYIISCPHLKKAGKLTLGLGSGASWKAVITTDWLKIDKKLVKVLKNDGANVEAHFLDDPSKIFGISSHFLISGFLENGCRCPSRYLFILGCQCGSS